jgi:hypothetical protein
MALPNDQGQTRRGAAPELSVPPGSAICGQHIRVEYDSSLPATKRRLPKRRKESPTRALLLRSRRPFFPTNDWQSVLVAGRTKEPSPRSAKRCMACNRPERRLQGMRRAVAASAADHLSVIHPWMRPTTITTTHRGPVAVDLRDLRARSSFLPNVQDEPRPWLARLVLL